MDSKLEFDSVSNFDIFWSLKSKNE